MLRLMEGKNRETFRVSPLQLAQGRPPDLGLTHVLQRRGGIVLRRSKGGQSSAEPRGVRVGLCLGALQEVKRLEGRRRWQAPVVQIECVDISHLQRQYGLSRVKSCARR